MSNLAFHGRPQYVNDCTSRLNTGARSINPCPGKRSTGVRSIHWQVSCRERMFIVGSCYCSRVKRRLNNACFSCSARRTTHILFGSISSSRGSYSTRICYTTALTVFHESLSKNGKFLLYIQNIDQLLMNLSRQIDLCKRIFIIAVNNMSELSFPCSGLE